MKRSTIQPVKGTRDFYPEEMGRRQWLYGRIRSVSRSFGYQEYEGPLLEPIALYAAKSGEELVNEQAFVLTDRGGDQLALRPELTPTLARMVAQRQARLPRPIRWWSFGPFWRYERPQKGRTREFFQWNIDLLGVADPRADAELIAIAASFLREAGLQPGQVVLQVNNRRLMEGCLDRLGFDPEMKKTVFRLVDKRDKLSASDWSDYAKSLDLADEQIRGLSGLLEDRDLWRQSEELVQTFDVLEGYGLKEYAAFEPAVIRGLDYYTGTVFEARDSDGEFRAILGGGRYDSLVADVGGDAVPAVGFAMGDVVISLVLEKYGCVPAITPAPARVLITVFSPELYADSVRAAAQLRRAGVDAELYPEPAKMARQFRYADQLGIPFAVVIGPEEAEKGILSLKELASGKQQAVTLEEAAGRLRG